MSTPTFPHESTANQFFGEAQFESYRALGVYAVDQLCEEEFGVSADSDQVVSRARLDEWLRTQTDVARVKAGRASAAVTS